MGVHELDPLIRSPTRVEGSLGIKKNCSVDLNSWGCMK